MHMRNMMSCHGSPSFTWWRRLGNGTSVVNPDFNNQDGTYLARGTLIRTYRVRESLGGRVTARLGVMRHVNNPKFGFLGKGPVSGLSYTSYTDFNFRKCNTIRQCSPQVNHLFSPCLALVPGLNVPHTHTQDFTLYGYVMPQRRIRRQPSDPIEGELLPRIDEFNCGSFGYAKSGTTSTCTLDMSVATLYRALCYSRAWRLSILAACPRTIPMTEANFVSQYCAPFASAAGTCGGKSFVFTRSPFVQVGCSVLPALLNHKPPHHTPSEGGHLGPPIGELSSDLDGVARYVARHGHHLPLRGHPERTPPIDADNVVEAHETVSLPKEDEAVLHPLDAEGGDGVLGESLADPAQHHLLGSLKVVFVVVPVIVHPPHELEIAAGQSTLKHSVCVCVCSPWENPKPRPVYGLIFFPSNPQDGFVPEWSPGNEDLREGMPCLLNNLANAFTPVRYYTDTSRTPPPTASYLEAMTCAQTVQDAIVSTPDGVPLYTFPVDPTNEDSPMRTEVAGDPLLCLPLTALTDP